MLGDRGRGQRQEGTIAPHAVILREQRLVGDALLHDIGVQDNVDDAEFCGE